MARLGSACGMVAVMIVLADGFPVNPKLTTSAPQGVKDEPMVAMEANLAAAEIFCSTYIGPNGNVTALIARSTTTTVLPEDFTITSTVTATPTLTITVMDDLITTRTTTVTSPMCPATILYSTPVKGINDTISGSNGRVIPHQVGQVFATATPTSIITAVTTTITEGETPFYTAAAPSIPIGDAPHLVHGGRDAKPSPESQPNHKAIAIPRNHVITTTTTTVAVVSSTPAFLASFQPSAISSACSCISASGANTTNVTVASTGAVVGAGSNKTVTQMYTTMVATPAVLYVHLGATRTVQAMACVTRSS